MQKKEPQENTVVAVKNKPNKRYPVNKHNLGIEFNVMSVMVPINFVYEYNILPWLGAGAGAGLVVSYGLLGADWLVKLGLTACPRRKVSPYLKFDFGGTITYNFLNSDCPVEYTTLIVPMAGIDIKQRKGDTLSIGLGMPWYFIPNSFPFPLVNLRIGYVF